MIDSSGILMQVRQSLQTLIYKIEEITSNYTATLIQLRNAISVY